MSRAGKRGEEGKVGVFQINKDALQQGHFHRRLPQAAAVRKRNFNDNSCVAAPMLR